MEFNEYIPAGYKSWTEYYRKKASNGTFSGIMGLIAIGMCFVFEGLIESGIIL
jgi:hypothetical protein